MCRKCTSLKRGEQVVFLVHSDIYNRKVPMDGSVVFVYPDRKRVLISWLEGYKNRDSVVSFNDMLAVYNPNGEIKKFENISGRSDILVPE